MMRSRLTYFSRMAQKGNVCLHTGGLRWTARLLRQAGVVPDSNVLEVGCGTGISTHMMLRFGCNVTVVDASREMLNACERQCRSYLGRLPAMIWAPIERAKLDQAYFDVALMECCMGFLADAGLAIRNIEKSLRRKTGVLCVNDYFYRSPPSRGLMAKLERTLGVPINAMSRNSVQEIFRRPGLECIFWEERSASTLAYGEIGCATDDEEGFRENRELLTSVMSIWRVKVPTP